MLPQNAIDLIDRLNRHGFEAYAVGGCVRDMLLGKSADDVDITTSASPEDTCSVFSSYRVIPTGLQHGTITVLCGDEPFEITTYRTDGTYSDGRHPDCVEFTASLEEDLARRDFTVNAIAYHPTKGFVDPFSGIDDVRRGILRCVGNPQRRFSEDALRIARLARFRSVLGFRVDPETADAAHRLNARLDAVAAERKRVELVKWLCGDHTAEACLEFSDVMCRIIPALIPCIGFKQHNPHHDFDVYTHSIRAVAAAPKDATVRMAMLLHDIGKPSRFSTDTQGIGHFYGHAAVSAAIAEEVMRDLRFDNATARDVTQLVKYHDIPLPADRKILKRRLARFSHPQVVRLLQMQAADAASQKENAEITDQHDVYRLITDILRDDDCIDRRQLQLRGDDLLAAGYPKGPLIGTILQAAFDAVVDDELPNDREKLLDFVKARWPL